MAYKHATSDKLCYAIRQPYWNDHVMKGYRMIPSNLKVIAKFCLCSNCLQKLDECSLACARKIFATARMLGFFVKIPCRVG